jgi:hypothetical protein
MLRLLVLTLSLPVGLLIAWRLQRAWQQRRLPPRGRVRMAFTPVNFARAYALELLCLICLLAVWLREIWSFLRYFF